MARNLIKKVCLLGDGAVGKTSLIRKFVYDEFDDKYLMTIGTKITKKTLSLSMGGEDVSLTLMINDIVGQVEFESIHRQYYRGSKGGMFVCDLTRKDTLDRMDWWMKSFRQVAGDVPVVLIGNKLDLEEEREIDNSDIMRYSARYDCPHFLASARTGDNVESAFGSIGRLVCSPRR